MTGFALRPAGDCTATSQDSGNGRREDGGEGLRDGAANREGTALRRFRHGRLVTAGIAVLILVGTMALAPVASAETVAQRFAADPAAAQAALTLARETFDAWVLRHERPTIPDDLPPLLQRRSAVFVSAMLGDAPRCCMGTLYPTRATLARQIVEAAVAAAGMDVRFPPITPEELPRVRLIVSVLEPPEHIDSADGLDPAREGLAVRGAKGWGVVLPRETPRAELIEPWARIRASVGLYEDVDYYRVRAFRIVETDPEM